MITITKNNRRIEPVIKLRREVVQHLPLQHELEITRKEKERQNKNINIWLTLITKYYILLK